jgi:hypothetical protein
VSTFQELCEAAFAGKVIQCRDNVSLPVKKWIDFTESAEQVVRRIAKHTDLVYRIKPDIRAIIYRTYLRREGGDLGVRVCSPDNGNSVAIVEKGPYFIKWLGDEQTIEVEL